MKKKVTSSLQVLSFQRKNKIDMDNSDFVCLVDENLAFSAYGRSNITGKEIMQDRVVINGNVKITILYISSDDSKSIKSIENIQNFNCVLELKDLRQNMELNISTNQHKVIESGSIISYEKDSDIEMNVAFENGFSFKILFLFIDEKIKESRLDKEIKEGNKIIFKCVNFDNALGTGTVKPVSLATIENKEVFLHFWVYLLADKGARKLEYTFLERG